MKKNLILVLRLGSGFPTSAESEAISKIVDFNETKAALGLEEPVACGTSLHGPQVPIPGLNRDGHMCSILETEFSAAEVSKILSEADDYLPALCIDITDQIETADDDGNIAINAQLAHTGLGKMFIEVFEIEPQGEFDAEEEKKKMDERRAEMEDDEDDEDCDCPACELRKELFDEIEGLDGVGIKKIGDNGIAIGGEIGGLDGLKGLKAILEKLIEKGGGEGLAGMLGGGGEDMKERIEKLKKKMKEREKEGKGPKNAAKKYRKKSCKMNLDQLLDIVKEHGVDKLTEDQRKRLDQLSQNPE